MARNDLENMSYAELTEMESKLARLKLEKQNQERAAVKERILAIAKDAGFDIQELFGRGRGAAKGGKVAPKYRDPKNPENTWTGRGRMPRWMTAATKGNKSKRDDFLIK